MAFPISPIDGQIYTNALGTVYRYVAAHDAWDIVTQVVSGVTGPVGPAGLGYTGLQGVQGATGPLGGPQGVTGLSGNTGVGFLQGALNFSMSAGIGSVPSGIMGQTVLMADTHFDTWTLLTDTASSINVDIQKSSYASYPTTTSLHGSTGVFINSSTKNTGTTTSWSGVTGATGDILKVILSGTDGTASKVSLILKYS